MNIQSKNKKVHSILYVLLCVLVVSANVFSACNRKEINLEDIESIQNEYASKVFEKTITKPGPPKYDIGTSGGTYYTSVDSDPKSFNSLNARDGLTAKVTDQFYPSLFDYNPYTKAFEPDLAFFEVSYDESRQESYIEATLRKDVYWTTKNGSRVKITSDDILFWYNEVEGDKSVQHPGYPGQFMTTLAGEKKRIKLEKIDEHSVKFTLPIITAEPLLSVNMTFGPRYIFEPAKKANGVNGLYDVLSVDKDPRDVPSAKLYMLSEYSQGQHVVFERNPDYWDRDAQQNRLPYIEKIFMKIIASEDVKLLSFMQGELSAYAARPEDLDALLENPLTYDVYNAGASLASSFISFNQKPDTIEEYKTEWFSNKYFRQAMSALLPRQRIVNEVYRGLAEPAVYFFAKANEYFDENIVLKYQFNPKKAKSLLRKGGFRTNGEGKIVDKNNIHVEFDIMLGSDNSIGQDIASLFADELNKVGITLRVKPIDFQNLVERVTKSYNWDSIMVGLGANYFPSSGSNVWQSSGNFHLWNPLQEKPATEWEARIDELYQKGLSTIDKVERKRVYDEYQKIILEQLPLMYIVHSKSFVAYDKGIKNVFVDALEGSTSEFIFIQQ